MLQDFNYKLIRIALSVFGTKPPTSAVFKVLGLFHCLLLDAMIFFACCLGLVCWEAVAFRLNKSFNWVSGKTVQVTKAHACALHAAKELCGFACFCQAWADLEGPLIRVLLVYVIRLFLRNGPKARRVV